MPPSTPSSRNASSPDANHHLSCAWGCWLVGCSISPTRATKEKLSFSLRTKCMWTARLRRDIFFEQLHANGLPILLRRQSPAQLAPVSSVPPHLRGLSWRQRATEALAVAIAARLDPEDLPADRTPDGEDPGATAAADHLFIARL